MSLYPGVSLITLEVADLDRARSFYERVGWRRSGCGSDVDLFRLNNITLALTRRERSPGAIMFSGVTLAQYHGGRSGVDRALSSAVAAGGVLLTGAVGVSVGEAAYGGAFADPEGHVWDMVYDPALLPDADGGVTPAS